MPAVPVMAAIGTAMGASAATAATVGTITTMTAGSLALQGASMVSQARSGRQSAALAEATAQHNAQIDIAQAQQLDLDTKANIRTMRAEDAVYTSRQKTAYAAAGVLSSGSPLAVEATTVGRMEQRVQQAWVNSQQKQQELYSAAKVGQLYGRAQADAIRTQTTSAMLSGGAHLLSTAAGAYQSGALSLSPSLNPEAKK